MAGVGEAATIIGLISGVIATAGAIKTVYDAAADAQGLPEAFREVAQRLPVVENTLRAAEEQLGKGGGDETTLKATRVSVENAKLKAEQLESIFKKCVPAHNASAFDRYVAALRNLGKEHKVEVLMKGLLENVQDLAYNRAIRAATEAHVTGLAEALEAISSQEASVPDEMIEGPPISGRAVHMGTGDIISAGDRSEQYYAKDNATQYNSRDHAKQYNATTISIHEKD